MLIGLLALSLALYYMRLRKAALIVSTCLLFAVLSTLAGCTSGGGTTTTTTNSGTPAGTYTVTVTGVSGSTNVNAASGVSLTVTQ
jgi:hypothetical protein